MKTLNACMEIPAHVVTYTHNILDFNLSVLVMSFYTGHWRNNIYSIEKIAALILYRVLIWNPENVHFLIELSDRKNL